MTVIRKSLAQLATLNSPASMHDTVFFHSSIFNKGISLFVLIPSNYFITLLYFVVLSQQVADLYYFSMYYSNTVCIVTTLISLRSRDLVQPDGLNKILAG